MNATADFYSKPSGMSAYSIYGRTKGVKQFGGKSTMVDGSLANKVMALQDGLKMMRQFKKHASPMMPILKRLNPFRGVNGTSFLEELF